MIDSAYEYAYSHARMAEVTLREARTNAGMTQDELAQKSGVDQTSISALECGRRSNPSFDTVKRLAKALEIDPSSLRFDDADSDGQGGEEPQKVAAR